MGWGDHEFYVGWVLVEEDLVEGFICQGWVVAYRKGLGSVDVMTVGNEKGY
jgi:hypothetical protein